MMPTRWTKQLVIAILAGVIASSVLGGFGLQTIGPTKIVTECMVDGHNVATLTGEMELNMEEFLTGWKATGGEYESEEISVEAMDVTFSDENQDIPGYAIKYIAKILGYRYDYFIDDVLYQQSNWYTGGGYRFDPNSRTVQGTLLTPPDITLEGVYDGSILTVKCIAIIESTIYAPAPVTEKIVTPIARYDASLIDGSGQLIFDQNQKPTTVGTSVSWYMQTGASKSGEWECYIYPPSHTGEDRIKFNEDGFSGQDNFASMVDFEIPSNWFKEGADDNTVWVRLFSGDFEKPVFFFFAVDDQALTPGNPSGVIESVGGDGFAGSTMTVNMSATPNAVSMSPISHFRVWVYYGGTGSMPPSSQKDLYIIYGKDVMADAEGKAKTTFQLRDGYEANYVILVHAIDEAGRASAGETWAGFASETDPLMPDPEDIEFPWIFNIQVIGIMIVAVLATIGIMIYLPLPAVYKLYILTLVLAALAYLAWLAGRGLL